jgi:hypothetical protein
MHALLFGFHAVPTSNTLHTGRIGDHAYIRIQDEIGLDRKLGAVSQFDVAQYMAQFYFG